MSNDGTYIEDRSTVTQRVMEQYSKGRQKGLQDIVIDRDYNRKTSLALVMCPEWDPGFPHYSIAKLAGVAKSAGYRTKAYDLNVEAYHNWETNDEWGLEWQPWDGPRDWHWLGEQYWKDLHEFVKPVLDLAIDDICKFKPDFVGFSLYYCNKEPTDYMIKEIKKRRPDTQIIIGGPQTHYSWFKPEPWYEIVVQGEGEQAILNILNAQEMKTGFTFSEQKDKSKIIRQDESVRFSLDNLPFPDYSDMQFEKYRFGDGALCAISRGCVAKCTFCEETHYYKYRQRTAVSTLDEVRHMYHTYGSRVFYFVDSLVNGNLKELRAFVEGVKAEGMGDIKWSGYCRHDGRMDLEYMQALKDGGCEVLNYGTESGSESVLLAMDKKVTLPEMEQNFIDGHKVGIKSMTNWIVGFPNETPKDLEDTFTLCWRVRHHGLYQMSQGTGFNVGVDTIVGQDMRKYGLFPFYYYGHWMKADQTASIVHKLIKMKTFSMFTDIIASNLYPSEGFYGIGEGGVPHTPRRRNLAERHYTIEFNDWHLQKEIEYDYADFDYNIIKPGISNFADSLVNEIWPFLRICWRARGGYKLNLKFVKEWEYEEWGDRNAAPLDANYDFEIDDDGNWEAYFWWDYQQDQVGFEWVDEDIGNGPESHIYKINHLQNDVYQNVNFHQEVSSSVVRARRLAWKGQDYYKERDPYKAFDKIEWMNDKNIFAKWRTHDFSFKYQWKGSGKWTN